MSKIIVVKVKATEGSDNKPKWKNGRDFGNDTI